MSHAATTPNVVNGLDVAALMNVVEAVTADPAEGIVAFKVETAWTGGATTESTVDSYTLGGKRIERSFQIQTDEPVELLGTNTMPNPQELLMAAMNACMTVGYVAGAAVHGITLERLEIVTDGELDLRGFLGIDGDVKPGNEALRYTVRIKGDGTPEQFQAIHENVMRTSPNYDNVANPVRLLGDLVVE